MKKVNNTSLLIVVVVLCNFKPCFAQDGESVLKKYKASISKIQSLSYQVNSIDTFMSGNVWNNTGYCHLRREPGNKLFGFSFLAKRNDIPEQSWYDGQYFFSVNHEKKNYGVNHNPRRGVLGHPGGQMVSAEMLIADTGYNAVSVLETPDHYVLRLQFPDKTEYDITNRNKLLYLDKKTYLPQRIVAYQQSLDKRLVSDRLFSGLVINDPKTVEQMASKEFLSSYELLVPDTKNELEPLLGKQAPKFAGQTFSGKAVSLEQLSGKLVLLDFWEVWCGPCAQSMPKVQAMHEKYGVKGLVVLGVTLDKNNLSSNKLFAEKKKLTFTNLLSDEEMKKGYKVNAIPEYVLIDKTGKIILAQAGFTEEIEKQIIKELEGK